MLRSPRLRVAYALLLVPGKYLHFVLSRGGADVYTTLEPQAAFHKRITFCLNVHNDAVRAMSYPPDSHKDELPDAETLKERQREEQELVAELAEEEEEMGDGF